MNNLEVIRKFPQPELVKDAAGKQRSSRFGWNHGVATQALYERQGRWTPIEEFCRIFYHKVSDDNRRRVRRALSPLARYLLENHHIVLVVEPINSRGLAGQVKLLDKTSELEKGLVAVKARKMRSKKELNEAQYQLLLQLADLRETVTP